MLFPILLRLDMGLEVLDVDLAAGALGCNSARLAVAKELTIGDMPLSISGVATNIPQLPLLVNSETDNDEYDGRMGLATFLLFKSVSFELSGMIMYPSQN